MKKMFNIRIVFAIICIFIFQNLLHCAGPLRSIKNRASNIKRTHASSDIKSDNKYERSENTNKNNESNASSTIPGWTLIWSDEFNGTSLDKTKWDVWDWASTKSNELEYYLPDEVWLENGILRIRSQKRTYKGRQYTSGKLTSQHSLTQTYGRFEIRAKLPTGKGMWPAFWLTPVVGWPPEIDVFEVLGHKPDTVYMTNHFKKYFGRTAFKQGVYRGVDYSKDFHVYAVEWDPGVICWYIDGVERFRSTESVPDQPMFMIINNAVGGNWPGNPDNTTVFPQYFDIDYVRVYKKK